MFFLGLILVSCTQEEDLTSNDAIQLESPTGFKIADDLEDLYDLLAINSSSEKILSIKFLEDEKMNAAFISYNDTNGKLKNTVLVRGMFGYDSKFIQIDNNQNNPTVSETTYALNCSGCEGCTVQSIYDPKTEVHTFQCSSACCVLNVTTVPIGG